MSELRAHIFSKIAVVLLSMILLVPVVVKISHVFEHHNHKVCKTPYQKHFHEYEQDCKFYNFRLNNYFYSPLESPEIISSNEISCLIISQYYYINDFQILQFSLRGPPQIV